MADSTFRVGGLASGMDTNSIIDQLVTLESQPITILQQQQSAVKTQVSALADLVSSLSSLQTATDDLGQNGVLSTATSTANTSFSAAPGSSATPGDYSVQVVSLARASKWRSAGFGSGAGMTSGTLRLTVQGVTYPPLTSDPLQVTDGESLADVAFAIQRSGAPVSATVLSDGTSSYLSITARDTGYPLGGTAASALSVDFQADGLGTAGQAPAFAEIQGAQNAHLVVDGLDMYRQANTISDAVPGTTLTLKTEGGPAEDLVLGTDVSGTAGRLQKFVDAYNALNKLVQRQLNPSKDTDRSTSLVGDAQVRSLQEKMHALVSSVVPGLATVRTLADVGVKTNRDGSLSLDQSVLTGAMDRDPAAVNALFSTKGSGISALVDTLVTQQTEPGDGALVTDQASLNDRVSQMDDQITQMQARIDAFRTNLVNQFAAMENTVSGLKSVGSYLTSWASAQSSSK